MNFKITTIVIGILVFVSCKSVEKVTDENPVKSSVDMQKEGFLKGEVIHSKVEGDCAFSIKTMDGKSEILLDPTNLTEEYQVNGLKIWFKYKGLRMANRCDKAIPVEIEDISSRKE